MKKNWKLYLTALFGLAVFCFWGYVRPEVILARESFLLFLYQDDYLMERLAFPGGMARYVGEFLVQFFRFVTLGALLSAILLVAIQQLFGVLLKRVLPAVSEKILFPVSFLPSVVLCYLLCDLDFSMTLPVGLLFTLVLILLLPHRKMPAFIVSCLLVPIGYWLAGPIIVLLPLYHLRMLSIPRERIAVVAQTSGMGLLLLACIIFSSYFVPYSLENIFKGLDYQMIQRGKYGTDEEMVYDRLLRMKDWNEIVRRSNEQEPQSLACKNVVRLAKYYLKQISGDELKENLLHTYEVLTSGMAAMMMSDVYLHMGFPNISQRAAFEVLESTSNYNTSGRELSRLVETALITGQYEVALKYISLLESTLFYRNWAKQMRELAAHPETIKRVPFYGPLQDIYGQTVDVNFF